MTDQIQLPALPASVDRKTARALYPLDAFGAMQPIAINDRLVPADTCQQALAAAQAEISGGTPKENAARAAKWIIDQYPKMSKEPFHDEQTYKLGLVALLMEYPETVVQEAAMREVPRRYSWMPSQGQIVTVLDDLMAARRMIIIGAKRQLAEHERRAKEAAREAEIARDHDKVAGGFADLMAGLKGIGKQDAEAAE